MSKVDDELTRRFRRAERPADGEALFEGLERRRSHRERLRKVQAGLLAFAVLAATAGGFVALQTAFGGNGGDIGEPPILPSNGEIVFSREGDDGRFHLYAAQPDGSGVRQITNDPTNDSDPTVSPDGTTIAYVRASDESGLAIVTVPLEGGSVIKLADGIFVDDPAWSPDGTEVAFVSSGVDSILLGIVDRNGRLSRSLLDVDTPIASPSWSPDGSRIAIGVVPEGSRGSVGIIPADTSTENPLDTTLGVGWAPAWSPDGTKVAHIRAGDDGDELWTVAPDGTDGRLIATAVEASLEPDLAWAPDGSALLVSDGDWIYRVDATPEGDPRDNFVQLVEGQSPSWQPLPAGSELTPTPSPEPSSSPEPAARDIGLGFPLCDVQQLQGIDWYGDGTEGAAWTGARMSDGGRCPSAGDGEYVVAADLDGDGKAEPGGMGFLEHCLFCRPFAATDLSGDGVLELIVLEEGSSTPSYSIYEVSVPISERSPGIYALFVAPPGAPEANLPANAPIRFIAGGDEGFSGGLRCENYPEDPVIVYTWFFGEVDADTDLRGHETRLSLGDDGIFHVLDTNDFTIGRDEPTNISTAPACGVDFHPAA
jgi:Tol biopolymer transport system component